MIDHDVHAKDEITCAICHNRVAHNEGLKLTLNDPNTGEPNRPHHNFMSMTACFRCHTQDKQRSQFKAPGECLACHPPEFDLKPASHKAPGFFPKGHGELGKAAAAKAASATAEPEAEEESAEGTGSAAEERENAKVEETYEGESVGESLPSVESINECYTCHAQKFCDDCHGAPMPHPADFKKNHGDYGKENPEACAQCHGRADRFCNECHHKTALDRTYDTTRSWITAAS